MVLPLGVHISARGVNREIYFVMASVLYSIKIAINEHMCVLLPPLRLEYFCNACNAFDGASYSQMWPVSVCSFLMLYRHQSISNLHVSSDTDTLALISVCVHTCIWFCDGTSNTTPHYRLLHDYICDGEILWESFLFLSMQMFIKMCTLFNFTHSKQNRVLPTTINMMVTFQFVRQFHALVANLIATHLYMALINRAFSMQGYHRLSR